jgi:hypothetical protein
MATGLDSTKTAAQPSHEAIENTSGTVPGMNETAEQRLDREAMELAKRGQNREHVDAGKIPGSSIFTK